MPPSPAKKLSTESNFVKLEEGEPVYENNNDIIELILKRAQLSKITTAFRSRLALASFKAQRGWQAVKLEVIESHLELEAQKRFAATNHGSMNMDTGEMGPPVMYHSSGLKRKSESMEGVDCQGRTENLGRGFGGGDLDQKRAFGGQGEMAIPLSYRHDPYTSTESTGNWAVQQFQPSASTSALENPYDSPHHTPIQSTSHHPSPHLSTSQIFTQSNPPPRTNSFPSSPQKPTPHFLMGHSSPPRKHASPRRPIVRPMSLQKESSIATPATFKSASPALSARQRKIQQAGLGVGLPSGGVEERLSSSDPTFSSFVNAANALTGLSHHRTPSGTTIFGPPPTLAHPSPFRSNQENQPILSPSHFLSPSTQNGSNGRPQTPPSGRLMASGSIANNPQNTSAAELMLFLAASPSPVQTRKRDISGSTALLESGNFGEIEGGGGGEGEIMKGRRLFSGLDEFSSTADIFSGTTVGDGSTRESNMLEPSKISNGNLLAPTTPSRERDRSVSAGDWGAYLNNSPELKVSRALSDAY